jgi:hypothetical protein
MSVNYNTSVVPNGLVLYLDAANPKSYPRSGTTIYNLSDSQKNGTFGGGLTYSGTDGGRFEFDGINSVINLGTGNTFFPLETFTIEIWFRSTGTTPTTGTNPGLFGATFGLRAFVFSNRITFGVNIDASSTTTNSINTPLTFNFYNGGWNQVVLQASATQQSIYVNGVIQTSTAIASWVGTTFWPTNGFSFGRDNNNVNNFFTGSMSVIKIYNKYLTGNEILENFNAVRGRYGI